MAEHWEALAEAVRARRLQLALRQGDLESRGGPSTGTVRNVEQAARTTYARRTMPQLETALGWRPGTVAELLAGTRSPQDVHLLHPTQEMIHREAERVRQVSAAFAPPLGPVDTALDTIARAQRDVRRLRGTEVNPDAVRSVEDALRTAWETLLDAGGG